MKLVPLQVEFYNDKSCLKCTSIFVFRFLRLILVEINLTNLSVLDTKDIIGHRRESLLCISVSEERNPCRRSMICFDVQKRDKVWYVEATRMEAKRMKIICIHVDFYSSISMWSSSMYIKRRRKYGEWFIIGMDTRRYYPLDKMCTSKRKGSMKSIGRYFDILLNDCFGYIEWFEFGCSA